MFNKIQRFLIIKLAIGAASVAIGTFFVGMNNSQQVFADTTATASESSQGARTNEPAATDSKQEIKPSTETKEETTTVKAQENVKAVPTPNNPEPTPAPETTPNEYAPIPHPSDVPAEPETNHYVETVKPHATSVSKVSISSKTNTRVISAKTENNDIETLPKTGEGQNQSGIIGLLLANLASLFGLAAGKKKN